MRRRRRIIHKIVFTFRILILLSLSFGCIYGGLYLEKISKPKTIINSGIDGIRLTLKDYLKEEVKYNIGENYSVKGNLKFKLLSDYHYNNRLVNEDSLKKINLIINLDDLDSNYLFVHDKKNKKMFLDVSNKIGNEDICSLKFYGENSTQYYFVNGIVSNYVNNGNFNYFESLNDEVSSGDNIEYLYDYLFNTISNSISDDDISEYDLESNINGKSMDVHEVSVKLSNRVVRESLSNYLELLKGDERTNTLITNVFNSFSEFNFDDSKSYIDNNESITFNVYTTKYLYKPLKYELVYIKDNTRLTYYYEVNDNGGTYYMIDGDKLKYKVDFKINSKNINGVIYDSDFKEIGSIKLSKDNTGIDFSYNFDNNGNKSEIYYDSKYEDVVLNESYTNNRKLSIKIIENGASKLSGSITLTTNVSKDTSINEDISESILSSSLTDEVKAKLDNKFDDVINRLEK